MYRLSDRHSLNDLIGEQGHRKHKTKVTARACSFDTSFLRSDLKNSRVNSWIFCKIVNPEKQKKRINSWVTDCLNALSYSFPLGL